MPASEGRPHRVIVFTTPTCPWCTRTKSYLRSRGVKFREVDVARDTAAARHLMSRTGQKGVPYVEIDGTPFVAFDPASIASRLGLTSAAPVHSATATPPRGSPMSETLQPLGARVLVKITPEETTTKSGLVLPDTAKEKPQRGEVVAIGDDEEMINVAPGEVVLFPKYTGTEFRIEDEDYLVIESGDLLAKVNQI